MCPVALSHPLISLSILYRLFSCILSFILSHPLLQSLSSAFYLSYFLHILLTSSPSHSLLYNVVYASLPTTFTLQFMLHIFSSTFSSSHPLFTSSSLPPLFHLVPFNPFHPLLSPLLLILSFTSSPLKLVLRVLSSVCSPNQTLHISFATSFPSDPTLSNYFYIVFSYTFIFMARS